VPSSACASSSLAPDIALRAQGEFAASASEGRGRRLTTAFRFAIGFARKESIFKAYLNFPILRVFSGMILVISYAMIGRRKSEDMGGFSIIPE